MDGDTGADDRGWRSLLAATPREVQGLLVLLLVAALATLAVVWRARPTSAPVDGPHLVDGSAGPSGRDPAPSATPSPGLVPGDPSPSGPLPGPTAPARPTGPARLVVHVSGAVRRPGIVTVPGGSRVADAVDAAGGLSAPGALHRVNLARRVVDGEQIHVPRPGEPVRHPSGPATPAPTTAPAAPLDINVASATELESLPGVGPVLARRIVDHRDAHGPFTAVADLERVSGIGPATLAELADRVRV